MICTVSYFLCGFFFNKIKFLGGLEVEHYWSSEKGKKAMYIWIIYYYKVSIRY